jgi:TonB family protein
LEICTLRIVLWANLQSAIRNLQSTAFQLAAIDRDDCAARILSAPCRCAGFGIPEAIAKPWYFRAVRRELAPARDDSSFVAGVLGGWIRRFDATLRPATPEPPQLIAPVSPPQAPALIAVAEPNPAIAFALPVEGPVRIVEPKQATSARQTEASTPAPAAAPPVQAITYGEGEGKQPAPEYPRPAIRAGQEGTVTVRMSVSEEGRVLAAEAVSPSPWPLLNDAALRAVRQRWRFRPGPLRLYEVAIRFELHK